jgi:hypothetical protein
VNENPKNLRGWVMAIEATAWSHPDSAEVRKIAERIAAVVDAAGTNFGLAELARHIPTIDYKLHGFPKPGEPERPRDEKTDAALWEFMRRVHEALAALADYRSEAEANATLPRKDRRELALRAIAAIDDSNGGEPIWFADVQWKSRLIGPDVRDAVEHWLESNMVRGALVSNDREDAIARFRMTPRGRDRAAAGPDQETPQVAGGIHLHQHGPGSVQQVGPGNVAHVQQMISIPNLTEAIATIRGHLDGYSGEEREEVESQLEVLESEAKGRQRPSHIKAALKAIQRITIEAQKTFAPTITAVVAGVVSGSSP